LKIGTLPINPVTDLVNSFTILTTRKYGWEKINAGEISVTTSWYNREVSSGHSTQKKRGAENCIGLTIGEGLNAILSEIR